MDLLVDSGLGAEQDRVLNHLKIFFRSKQILQQTKIASTSTSEEITLASNWPERIALLNLFTRAKYKEWLKGLQFIKYIFILKGTTATVLQAKPNDSCVKNVRICFIWKSS